MRLAIIRHGPTEWNAQGRIQGRTDIPLSEIGRAKMSLLGPPQGFEQARAFSSPLIRARETAALLGLKDVQVDPRLSEHHWGRWEGMTRAEILDLDGGDAFDRAGRGAAFRPPEGESTADFLARVANFLRAVATDGSDAIAIAHRGVLRSAYTLATGWDMTTPMPAELDLGMALVLDLAPDGTPSIAELNAPLTPRTA